MHREYTVLALLLVILAGAVGVWRLSTPDTPAPRLVRDVAPSGPTVLPDGAVVAFSCANNQLTGGFAPNQVTVSCASATPTPTASDTPTATVTLTPTATETATESATATPTVLPTDTETPIPPTETAVPTATPSSTPPTLSTPTPTHFAGNLGFLTTQANIGQWNSLMRTNDVTGWLVGRVSLASQIKVGQHNVALQLSGTTANPTSQVTTTNLATIDATLQATYGPVVEWIAYGDDDYTDTVGGHIAALKSNVDFIRGYPRANGAPPFKVLYIPAGAFLNANLANNSILATYPDGVLFQSQSFEDQANGADTGYLLVVKGVMALLAVDAPTHPAAIQVQVYSKSNPTTVWTVDKMVADIDAVGPFITNGWVTIYASNPSNATAATNVLNSLLAIYRP